MEQDKDLNRLPLERTFKESNLRAHLIITYKHSPNLPSIKKKIQKFYGNVDFIQSFREDREKIAVGFQFDMDALMYLRDNKKQKVEPTNQFKKIIAEKDIQNRRDQQLRTWDRKDSENRFDSENKVQDRRREWKSDQSDHRDRHEKDRAWERQRERDRQRQRQRESSRDRHYRRGQLREQRDQRRNGQRNERRKQMKDYQERNYQQRRRERSRSREKFVDRYREEDYQKTRIIKIYGVPMDFDQELAVKKIEAHLKVQLKIKSFNFNNNDLSCLEILTTNQKTVQTLLGGDVQIDGIPLLAVESDIKSNWKSNLKNFQVSLKFHKQVDAKRLWQLLSLQGRVVSLVKERDQGKQFVVTMSSRVGAQSVLKWQCQQVCVQRGREVPVVREWVKESLERALKG